MYAYQPFVKSSSFRVHTKIFREVILRLAASGFQLQKCLAQKCGRGSGAVESKERAKRGWAGKWAALYNEIYYPSKIWFICGGRYLIVAARHKWIDVWETLTSERGKQLLVLIGTVARALRSLHTATCVEASTLLPIHFEWGDVTLRRTALWEQSVARFKSRAMFYFWSFDGSVSQSNHMPVQALANLTACLCVRGGRFMWLVVGRGSDTPPASFNARRRV